MWPRGAVQWEGPSIGVLHLEHMQNKSNGPANVAISTLRLMGPQRLCLREYGHFEVKHPQEP